MATEYEFSMRIDFFRDAPETLSVELLTAARDYVGSALKDGVRAACVPRVGEQVLPLATQMPHPHSPITGVVHNLAGVRLADDGETERSPSVTAVLTARWPGEDRGGELRRELENRGWSWREGGGLRSP